MIDQPRRAANPGRKDKAMYQNFAIMFQNTETKKIGNAVMYSRTVNEAIHDFHECYRHADYKILACVPVE